MSEGPVDAAGVAELVGITLDETLTSFDGVLAVGWNDLGEIEMSIQTAGGVDLWRLTIERVTEDD